MATFNKFNSFVEHLAEGVHNLQTGALTIALSNTLPVAANSVLADITQIAYTNLPTSRLLTVSESAQSGGLYTLKIADKVLTATGTVAAFRYVIFYNDTPTSPADPLIGWYDYGSSIVLNNGDTFTVDFDAVNGVLTIQ